MLLPIIDGPPQDRIAKHDGSAYGGLESADRLLHGPQAAGTGSGARRERGDDSRGNAPWASAAGDGRRTFGDVDATTTRWKREDGMGAGVELLERRLDHTRTVGKSASA